MAPLVAVPMLIEQLTSGLGQNDSVVTIARHPHGLDEPLFAQVSQVAAAWVCRAIVVAAKVAAGDYSEGTDGRQRTRFGAAQRALTVAHANDLALGSARQADVPAERVRSAALAVLGTALPLRRAWVL
jgi:methyl coenzyme M reductase alpha subunit